MFRQIHHPFLIAAATTVVCCVGAFAQEAQTPPAVVQEKVREWIRVKKTISAEKSGWEQQKATLSDLNEIRKKEIAKIDELIEAAGNRFADAEKQRAELTTEEVALQEKRALFEKRVIALEAGLRERVAYFPTPLLEKIDDEVGRLSETDSAASLQNRFRDVIAILTEAGAFENKITVVTDLQEIGDQQIEVDIIYVGLHHAYYVNRNGDHAGTGQPGADGWIWNSNNKLAGEIREAISIHRRETTPRFVKLPLSGKESAE